MLLIKPSSILHEDIKHWDLEEAYEAGTKLKNWVLKKTLITKRKLNPYQIYEYKFSAKPSGK